MREQGGPFRGLAGRKSVWGHQREAEVGRDKAIKILLGYTERVDIYSEVCGKLGMIRVIF